MSDPINNNLADTFSLKGFVSVGAFADNDRYEIAPLGELSLQSATYAKDRALYTTTSQGANPTTLKLSVFSCRTTEDDFYAAPASYQSLLLQMIRWCHAQALNGTFTNNAENARQSLMAEFDGNITSAVVGQMIQQDGVWLPASLQFYISPDSLGTWDPGVRPDLERSRIKLWFANEAFAAEYDEFDIEFLAPIDNARLDDFFLLAEQIEEKVKARTMEETMVLVHEIKDNQPETKIRTIPFLYHDPNNETWTMSTNWTFVIYGAAGDNIDSIKEELATWILDNSTHSREEWAVIFPDIFTSTEMIITPMWSNYSVENATLSDGVYSPTINTQQALAAARRTCTGTLYNNQHIDAVLSVVGCPYKSITLLAVGGPENRDGVFRFEEIWPDYMAVFTSSLDYNRMQPETQEWVALLHRMLKVAETMTDFSDLPQDMTRLRRTNAANETYMYVVANYNNVQYLVASRQSIHQHFPTRGTAPLTLTSEGADGVVAMPNARVGDLYTTTFVAKGGTQPYEYSLVSVSDETRLEEASIDPDTGEFIGSAVSAGNIAVTVRVRDIMGVSKTQTFTLHIYSAPQA